MAERQAGQHVAGGARQRQARIPVLRQDRLRQVTPGEPAAMPNPSQPLFPSFVKIASRGTGGARQRALPRCGNDNAFLADPDRRLCDLFALRIGRDRIYAHFRRHRGAQPVAWGNHGRGRSRRLGRLGKFRCGRLSRRRIRRRRRAPARALDLLSHRPAAAVVARGARGGEGDLHLTATLLWGIIIQEAIAYLYTNNAKSVLPIVDGVVAILACARPPTRFSPPCLLGDDRSAMALRQPHAGRKGGARRVDESARRHLARHRAQDRLCRRMGDLWLARRRRRRAARHVPRRLLV